MEKYEIVYILSAGLDEEARKAEIANLAKILADNGAEVTKTDEWGLRDFAYEINGQLKGYYVVLKVSASVGATAEFERLAKLNANVVRYLVTVDQE